MKQLALDLALSFINSVRSLKCNQEIGSYRGLRWDVKKLSIKANREGLVWRRDDENDYFDDTIRFYAGEKNQHTSRSKMMKILKKQKILTGFIAQREAKFVPNSEIEADIFKHKGLEATN